MPAHCASQQQRHHWVASFTSIHQHSWGAHLCIEHDIANIAPAAHCKLSASQGGLMKRISKGWKRGGSSQGTGSTISSSGADSRGSVRSGAMGSIAFTGGSSSGGRGRNKNLLMETNMAFEHGNDGGRTKRSHGTGFFAFSQVPTSLPVFYLAFHFLPFTFCFLTRTHFPSCRPSPLLFLPFLVFLLSGTNFLSCLTSLLSLLPFTIFLLTGTHFPSCLSVAFSRGAFLSCHIDFPLYVRKLHQHDVQSISSFNRVSFPCSL